MDLALLTKLKLILYTPLMYDLGQECHLTFYTLIFFLYMKSRKNICPANFLDILGRHDSALG